MKRFLALRIISTLIIALSVLGFVTTTAISSEEYSKQWDGEKAEITSVVTVTVEPITSLDVDVPLSITFGIDANRNIKFPEDVQIVSKSKTPLCVGVAADSSDINLVASDKFENWDNLGMKNTNENFALIVNGNDMINGQTPVNLGTLAFCSDDENPSAIDVDFNAKYGKAWGNVNTKSFTIDLMFVVSTPE